MKPWIVIVFGVLLLTVVVAPTQAQNLLNNPESVVYDSLHNRYLVSNWATGDIVQIDEFGDQTYFDTTLTRIAGILNVRDTLFVASNLDPYVGLVAYDLQTDTMLFYLPVPSVGLLNDLDYDTSGHIFMSDYWDHKLWRVDVGAMSCTLFVDTLSWPNGVLCDIPNNRLLVVSNDPGLRTILGVDLTDGSVSIVANVNGYSGDGLSWDDRGYLYVSSWTYNCCYRYDTLFTNPPELVSSGHDAPADIYINPRGNILCVPNFYRNTVDFIEVYPSSVDEFPVPGRVELIQNYPNPFNASTTIEYNLDTPSQLSIDVFDVMGKRVSNLFNGNQSSGQHKITWDADKFSTGVYFYKIKTDVALETRKMLLLK
ncbi:MAG: T9SS type A sorting domain-containing protein [candidate division Zixibacteria bacterium]|nr:T9SS type A sorting domain-containing protein [candidate division Zixibacteria bacterium]